MNQRLLLRLARDWERQWGIRVSKLDVRIQERGV